jgi:hypothetical protein
MENQMPNPVIPTRVGRTYSHAVTADGDDGREYEVKFYRVDMEVKMQDGSKMPVQNTPLEMELANGDRVIGSHLGGAFLEVVPTRVTLTRRP